MSLFHLSPSILKEPLLSPRVPKNAAIGIKEDGSIPRVCFSGCIQGCLDSIKWEEGLETYQVYVPDRWRKWNKVYVPSREKVWDQQETGEVWFTDREGILLRRIGEVRSWKENGNNMWIPIIKGF